MNKLHIEIKDLTNGKIVKKFEFDVTSMSSLFNNDIQKIKQRYIDEMKNKYPSYQYQIIDMSEPEPKTEEKPVEFSGIFRMEASARSLRMVNCSAIFLGIFLLFVVLFFRQIFTIGLFIFAACIIIIYMVGDYIIWQKNGIRVIEVDSQGINLYRGKAKRFERIEASQITDINVFKKVNRRIITILTGGQTYRAPGVTLFSGPKIRIADDSFNSEQFTIFIEKIKQIKK